MIVAFVFSLVYGLEASKVIFESSIGFTATSRSRAWLSHATETTFFADSFFFEGMPVPVPVRVVCISSAKP
jgi:hypothetical protein